MSLQNLFPTIAPFVQTADGPLSTSNDFEVLGLALDAAGLTGAVSGLEGFTLFAPTDDAFASLAQSLGFDGDPDDASAVFGAIAAALTGLSEDGDPIPLLTDILLYHVAPDEDDLSTLNAEGPVATLLENATFEVTDGTVIDGDPDYQNADVVAADVGVGAGTVQIVDQVLLPLDAPVDSGDPTLLGLLEESGGSFDDNPDDFDMLLTALQVTGLDEAVDNPNAELTVFAPQDSAFIALAQDLGYEGEDEAGAFQTIVDAATVLNPDDPLSVVSSILTYHVSPGEQDSTAVLGSETLATLQGGEIGVDGATLVDQDPNADDPMIIQTDLAASNGVAHVIDDILRPVDLPPEVAMPEDEIETTGVEDEEPVDDGGDDDSWMEALGVAGIFLALLFLV
ncbi:putative surface protein with fasciclin (FAS1) repeats [Shimia isoporae]|uniref:Putative surface protein with fasciclin (FAS1) repeats n=1 Tax=Shimia isoporae TaxID=647720 RepID=A0A4V2Q3W1_9RHOB|nr:fasciclin domain-containing protein [Shimia isoporae]TCL08740.1 putative surface protein with fasciclin (FAS1) repeats [Shimia isoporae]